MKRPGKHGLISAGYLLDVHLNDTQIGVLSDEITRISQTGVQRNPRDGEVRLDIGLFSERYRSDSVYEWYEAADLFHRPEMISRQVETVSITGPGVLRIAGSRSRHLIPYARMAWICCFTPPNGNGAPQSRKKFIIRIIRWNKTTG